VLALAVAVLVLYAPALDGEFVYDDLLVIQQNPQIASLANLPSIFAGSYWDFLDAEGASHVGYYRPLTMALVSGLYWLGDGAPAAFHWGSLLVYALACCAAWRFAARLLGSPVAGFWAALLFAVHPLHVESVAWISALHDPLHALFGFLALTAFLDWREGRPGARGWPVALWFFLALLSKDAAVAFPFVALVVELCRPSGEAAEATNTRQRLTAALIPFVAAFALYYLLRVLVFGDALAGFDRTTTDFGVGVARLALLRVELLGGAAWLLLWPAELNLFRPFQPELPSGAASLWIGVAGSLALLGAVALAWMRRWRLILLLLLWIPAGLAPVLLRVESLGTFPLSDRFLFVPVLGFTALLVLLVRKRLPAPAASTLLILVAAALAWRTWSRLPHWANEEALFREAVAQNPRNPNVHWGLGRVLLGKYGASGLADELIESRKCFETSMDLLEEAQTTGTDIFATQDDHLQTHLGLGHALLREAEVDPFHDYEVVRKVFERAIQVQPDSERGYIGLGAAWMAEGDPNEAGTALRRAIQINPNSPEAHFNMGVLMMRVEEWSEAAKEFERSLSLRNDNHKDRVFLARALYESGRLKEAHAHTLRAREQRPDDPDPLLLLGSIAANREELAQALVWFDQAIELAPSYGAAHLQRGLVLLKLERRMDAAKALVRACEILPENFEAHFNLMVLLLASDQPDNAIPYFFAAYRVRPPEFAERMSDAAGSIHQDDLERLVLLATIDADRGEVATAVRWIERALTLHPEHAPSHYIYGLLLRKLEQEAAALEHLEFAARELPDSYQAQMEFAEALLVQNQFVLAEPYLSRALELLQTEPMDPEVKSKAEEVIRAALENIRAQSAVGPPPPSQDS